MKASSLAFVLLAVCVQGNDLGRGFGDKYDWKTLEAGLAEVKSTGKLGVVFIHKSWCGACKSLAPKVAASEEILKASEDYVMINVHDDEEPKNGDKWKPDGGYIPRILFVDPDTGDVIKDATYEHGNPKYKYYYHAADSIASTMTGQQDKLKKRRQDAEDKANGKGDGKDEL